MGSQRSTGRRGGLATGLPAAVVSILSLGLLEAGLRLAGVNAEYRRSRPTILSREDPVLGYRVRPGLDVTATPEAPLRTDRLVMGRLPPFRVRTDSRGLRADHDVADAKPAGTWRVLALGDSYTFGYGVDAEETFASRLARRLSEALPGRKAEVVNAGQLGHSSLQGLRFYETLLGRMAADAVVASYGHNDYGISVAGYGSARERLAQATSRMARLQYLLRRSEIYVLLLRGRARLPGALRPVAAGAGASDLAGSPEDYERALAELASAALRRGARAVVIATEGRLPGNPHEAAYRAAARRAADRAGAAFVDGAAALEREMAAAVPPPGGWGEAPNRFFVDATHLSPEGHEVVARELFAVLAPRLATSP